MFREVLLPNAPKLVSAGENSAVFEVAQLYPGYGVTIGNALRRVLLSSIKGAAISRVHFDNVLHEFSTIPGVLDDVLDICLNLKQVRLSYPGDEPAELILAIKGKGEVKAGDIKGHGGLEVKNPDLVILTVTNDKTAFTMKLTAEKGIGYLPAELQRKERVEPGTIVLDAIFSPIRNVSYEVENMRVQDRTDFNLLRLTIETDGTIKPEEALSQATETLAKQLQVVLDGLNPKSSE